RDLRAAALGGRLEHRRRRGDVAGRGRVGIQGGGGAARGRGGVGLGHERHSSPAQPTGQLATANPPPHSTTNSNAVAGKLAHQGAVTPSVGTLSCHWMFINRDRSTGPAGLPPFRSTK